MVCWQRRMTAAGVHKATFKSYGRLVGRQHPCLRKKAVQMGCQWADCMHQTNRPRARLKFPAMTLPRIRLSAEFTITTNQLWQYPR